ncbi:Ig-like domain-containing protein [Frondihabitans australicus]|uniref:SDR-like Ig domain-containing protein n=1 Tax=Frondihabitans australicus TaxID=386892 RepID=A0A495IIL2_9MICO|nr:Ig-like domain-containing protein [Frondihabitans australicus]RKR75540.1 hypothetical protein C8E83_2688 [Frondihabitans australicus]
MPVAQSSRALDTSLPAPRRRSARRLLALLGAGALAVAGLTVGLSAPASAAVISGAISNVTVGPTNPEQGSQLTTSIDWKVPDNTKAGDTFTLTLSSHLKDLPGGFSLKDPATGAVVATATLSDTSPSVVTFTMTAYASTHIATHGTAFVKSDFDTNSTPSGVATPFTSTTNDGRSFTTVITPTGTVGDTAAPNKYGDYTRGDQGRTDPTDFLAYTVVTPEGALDGSTITDSVPAGQSWTFDCDTLQVLDGTFGASGFVDSYAPTTPVSQSCTPTAISVTFGPVAEGHLDSIQYSVSLPAATGAETAAQTFLNQAEVDWTPTGGTAQNSTVFASNTQSSDGGTGVGTPRGPGGTDGTGSGDTTTGGTTGAVAAASAGDAGTELAFTGSNTSAPLSLAAGLLALGGALTVVAGVRRRRAAR